MPRDTWTMDLGEWLANEDEIIDQFLAAVGREGPIVAVLYRYRSMMQGARAEAPFRKGDRVELVVEPIIGEASGWRGAKHFMVAGNTATVKCVKLIEPGWRVGVYFDDDSWLDADGQPRPTAPEDRGLYFFPATSLRKIEAAPAEHP